MKAMILSGGRGKRLRPVTDTIPKPLIKINGKPLIEWKINYLKKFGIKDIIICSGYKGKKIENYLKKKKNFVFPYPTTATFFNQIPQKML